MSLLSETFEELFIYAFPSHRLIKEKYVLFQNTRLFFDFYIPELKLYIEVQGDQHFKFNKFYHYNKLSFNNQVYRDKLKTQYVEDNKGILICLDQKTIESLSKETVKAYILNLL